ncbi:GNAT family N-acetyltransferase [Polymorphobacter fuscus]|uniref:GNAT family N-acetyltransferase n=1 Tax=Sandarakinorhabdus fusca TaxID=1439888 RepID=A0A7C9KXQ2_9SPHN|nr:GNAT family N-acetyltransferase [Polymorphobacter fuscus]KAB7648463.1 GNAT family N-acetyltransferase [Polymorphobacter fuscus]MQT15988.1 GNAT family N-acetyltransferase [Polymorphobacter fuscus]NJC07735.1 ribosomal protein S18 acetylase RimI-like enzyme [Polymorphobacter fuscus]
MTHRRGAGGGQGDGDALDRPVWSALATGWAHLARGPGPARRLDPDYGPFAATDGTPAGAEALRGLAADGTELWLVEALLPPLPSGLDITETPVLQLVAGAAVTPPGDAGIRPLGEADAAEMRALAELTAPGPFRARTHLFGDFLGIHDAGRLVAMAGTRMRLPGHVEVSGVCTHPDARGHGHAARLSRAVAARLQAQRIVPFLHAYPGNAAALALYTALGFTVRRALRLVAINGGAQMRKSHP